MTWFKLDDQSTFHAKVVAAGNQAWGAFCRAGTWTSAHGKDGFVPSDVAKILEPSKRVWDRLFDVGLLERVDGGWQLHDFTRYNPTAEAVASKREARQRAGSNGGKRSSETRAKDKQQVKQLLEHVGSNAEPKSNPDPDPDPEISKAGTQVPLLPTGRAPESGGIPGLGSVGQAIRERMLAHSETAAAVTVATLETLVGKAFAQGLIEVDVRSAIDWAATKLAADEAEAGGGPLRVSLVVGKILTAFANERKHGRSRRVRSGGQAPAPQRTLGYDATEAEHRREIAAREQAMLEAMTEAEREDWDNNPLAGIGVTP